MGRVVVPDIVQLEATYYLEKPYAREIATWLTENLAHIAGPALVVYENGRVPNMLSREGVAAVVAVATTRNLLHMAQEQGLIADAEAVWRRITDAVPTADPVSNLTFINPISMR